MILDDNSKFGLRALTRAIGAIEATPTQIRDLELFKPVYLSDTKVDIERQDTTLKLVQAKPRDGGTPDTVPVKNRNIRTFRIPHLPVHDSVLAEDVQGLRAFGTTEAETVMAKVEAKLADGKQNLEYTREHLMLGALLGKILDADGSEIYNIYKEFGLTRKSYDMKLSTETTEVGRQIDEALAKQRSALRGAAVTGWVALCGFGFIEALKYHKSVKPLYERWREGAAYREAVVAFVAVARVAGRALVVAQVGQCLFIGLYPLPLSRRKGGAHVGVEDGFQAARTAEPYQFRLAVQRVGHDLFAPPAFGH